MYIQYKHVCMSVCVFPKFYQCLEVKKLDQLHYTLYILILSIFYIGIILIVLKIEGNILVKDIVE